MHWQWSPLLKGRKWVYRRGLRWREKKNQHWDGADYLPSSPVFGWAHYWSWCKHSQLGDAVVKEVKEMWYFTWFFLSTNQEYNSYLKHEILLIGKYINLFDTFLNIKKFYKTFILIQYVLIRRLHKFLYIIRSGVLQAPPKV